MTYPGEQYLSPEARQRMTIRRLEGELQTERDNHTQTQKAYSDLVAERETLLAEVSSRWIPVSEREPEEACETIVAARYPVHKGPSDVFSATWDPDINEWVTAEADIILHVTHWMPLPSAPVSSQQEPGDA